MRNVKSSLLESQNSWGANDTLADADALKILQKLAKQGKDSKDTDIYLQQNREDLADAELAQVKVIRSIYLPKQLSAEELETALKEIIAEVGATDAKTWAK